MTRLKVPVADVVQGQPDALPPWVMPHAVACGEVVGQVRVAPLFVHVYQVVLPVLPASPSFMVEPVVGVSETVTVTESMFCGLVLLKL